jgi:ketosteroid isomerase-like protein
MQHETGDLAYFQSLYDAFNRRALDELLARMSADVDWPNAWQGGRLRGHDAVRRYWTEQWSQIDPNVEPTAVTTWPDGRIAVSVRQRVQDLRGNVISDAEVLHVYRLENGLISRMDVVAPAP